MINKYQQLFFMATSLRRNHFSNKQYGSSKAFLLFVAALFFAMPSFAQADSIPFYKGALKASRDKIYDNIINNTITKNLLLPLTDSTEENWEDAFYAMELTGYHTQAIDNTIKAAAFTTIEKRSNSYQRQLMEMVYTIYPNSFREEVFELCGKTISAKVFAMAAEYLARLDKGNTAVVYAIGLTRFPLLKFIDSANIKKTETYEKILRQRSEKEKSFKVNQLLKDIMAKNYLPGNTIVYSLQRKNRDWPGIVIIRDSSGNFVKDADGKIFSVPQLARSMSSLPWYLTNGNTPQGIFRMNGFEVSKLAAIGPTQNIQLMMPYETSPQFFLKDTTVTDTLWTDNLYEKLLPLKWKSNNNLWQTYYASKVGRTEIIAHGTTVNPEYYIGKPYYPHTPTEGCLCTKELWSSMNGKRTESNQQKLVEAVKKSGKSDGYLIVLEIDDQQKPVSLDDILSLLK